jgi:hypothetical protein
MKINSKILAVRQHAPRVANTHARFCTGENPHRVNYSVAKNIWPAPALK